MVAASSTGPKVIALGGGRGLAGTLRAVRRYASHTTAVVSTADDSGSSGRLRSSMGMPALGDIRRCMTAIAGVEDEPIGKAFEYRFTDTDLDGHALGNLILAGLVAVTGDLLAAMAQGASLLGLDPADGRVLPATVQPVGLRATTVNGTEVIGQYAISKTQGIRQVFPCPADVRAPDGLADAIQDADQVVLGPGSLYTSILATALVADLRSALSSTKAQRVYVCNLEPEPGETAGYDVAAHVAALCEHGVKPDLVLVHDGGPLTLGNVGLDVVRADLQADRANGLSKPYMLHDSDKLATALAALIS
jgi:uncharacterized cofD-like protein